MVKFSAATEWGAIETIQVAVISDGDTKVVYPPVVAINKSHLSVPFQ